MWMTRDEFDDAYADALDRVPQEALDGLDNVVFQVADEPTPQQRSGVDDNSELLGLYSGVSKPKRSGGYVGLMPDVIYLFAGPIQRVCASREAVVEQVFRTLMHEIGHHYGIDDARLHELGY